MNKMKQKMKQKKKMEDDSILGKRKRQEIPKDYKNLKANKKRKVFRNFVDNLGLDIKDKKEVMQAVKFFKEESGYYKFKKQEENDFQKIVVDLENQVEFLKSVNKGLYDELEKMRKENGKVSNLIKEMGNKVKEQMKVIAKLEDLEKNILKLLSFIIKLLLT